MQTYSFISQKIHSLNSASEYFELFKCNMGIGAGQSKGFDYSTKLCILGNSFVSKSISQSGWRYEAQSTTDGFLITIPRSGAITWCNSGASFDSAQGRLFLAEQRELLTAKYSINSNYTTIYLHYSDIYNYLALHIGGTPKSRINFTKRTAECSVTIFIQSLADTILNLASEGSLAAERSLLHLKECLISFFLYNLTNNYSEALRKPQTLSQISPHRIKMAAEYISLNYANIATVGELAQYSGISIRSLQLGFKEFKKSSPMHFLRHTRLVNARAMLTDRNSDLSAQEVARQCGFTNYHLFCKYYSLEFLEQPSLTLKNRQYDWP